MLEESCHMIIKIFALHEFAVVPKNSKKYYYNGSLSKPPGDLNMVRSKHNSILIKCPVLKYLLVFAFVNILPVFSAAGAECTSETYNQISFDKPQIRFNPNDKIFVKISCDTLDAGDHTLYINWVHNKVGIVRSDKQDFSVDVQGAGHTVYFWFKLTRQGPIKSAITNQDFYPGHLGDWLVEVSLGEDIVSSSSFSISENY